MTAAKKVKKPPIPRMHVLARRTVNVEMVVLVSGEKFNSLTNGQTIELKKQYQAKLRGAQITSLILKDIGAFLPGDISMTVDEKFD